MASLASSDSSPSENLRPSEMVFDLFAAVESAAWLLRHYYQVIIYFSFHAYDWQIKYTQQTSF